MAWMERSGTLYGDGGWGISVWAGLQGTEEEVWQISGGEILPGQWYWRHRRCPAQDDQMWHGPMSRLESDTFQFETESYFQIPHLTVFYYSGPIGFTWENRLNFNALEVLVIQVISSNWQASNKLQWLPMFSITALKRARKLTLFYLATKLDWQTDRPDLILNPTENTRSVSNSEKSFLTTSSISLKVNPKF